MPAPRPPAARLQADRDGDRLSDGLEAILAGKAGTDKVAVIVTFSGQGSAASARNAVGDFTVSREFSIVSGFAATMTAAQARGLSRASGVFRVEQDATVHATLETARRDFGVDALLLDPADPASQSPNGGGIDVCIVDTGIQANHEQFTDETGASRVRGFIDLVGDYYGEVRTAAYDDHGHGTHVAGIIGGDGTAGTAAGANPEIAPAARGVAPGVNLYAAKVLTYFGWGPSSGIVAAIEWCVAQGVDVANLSLGTATSSDGQDAVSLAVNSAVDQGVVVVAAAGNSGDNHATIGSPGAAAKAITVAAVAEYSAGAIDVARSLGIYPAPWSSRGPTADGRIKPDIAAPGVTTVSAITDVAATDPDPFDGSGGGIIDYGCGVGCYAVASGTSMASPFVAGTVALMLEADTTLSPAAVSQILGDTAQDRGTAGKDNVFGHGLIDVMAAVQVVKGGTGATTFPNAAFLRSSVSDRGAVRIPISVTDMTKPLAITITIDGKLTKRGSWSPDIDMILLDESGQPFLTGNPLYPEYSDDPLAPAEDTVSICPAGVECGRVGAQETIRILPSAQNLIVEIYPYEGRPNRGKGGSFSIELSNGNFN